MFFYIGKNQFVMKKSIIASVLCGLVIFSGCGTLSQTGKGAIIGSGAGAALGSVVGAIIGKDAKAAAIGAAVGTAVGAGTGALIGHKMDKKAEELAAIENAKIESITDVNGLPGIKVTFDSGILFEFNKSNVSATAKKDIADFASKMKDLEDTDITVYGHTDNKGTAEVNQRVSQQRADAVAALLKTNGIAAERITSKGMSFDMPVADNATEEGRQQNRRVEIYITADENMIAAAEAGNLE